MSPVIVVAPSGYVLTAAQVQALVDALTRIEATKNCPDYLRTAGAPLMSRT